MGTINILRSLKYAGATDLPEYDVQRGICVGVNILCISIFFLNLLSGPLFYWLSGNLLVLIGAYIEAALILGIIALNKLKQYERANVCFYVIILISTFYFSAILGKSSETQLMILFILGLTFFIFERTKTRILAIVTAFVLLFLLELNFSYLFIRPTLFSHEVGLAVRWLVYVVVISLVLLIFYLYQKNTGLLIRLHTYSKNIKASLDSEERSNELKNLYFQNISHDIKGCYVGLGILCNDVRDKAVAQEVVSAETGVLLFEQKEHYRSILDSFLEFSSFKNAAFNEIHLEILDVRREIERIADIYRFPAMKKNIQIEFVASARFPRAVLGARLKFARILINLLSNALKFSPPGSSVFIEIHHAESQWQLVVGDTGIGMRQQVLKNLFKPYVTEISDYNPDGIGLGLHITKYLIDLLGAEVQVESQVGHGTIFNISFPLHRELTPS